MHSVLFVVNNVAATVTYLWWRARVFSSEDEQRWSTDDRSLQCPPFYTESTSFFQNSLVFYGI